jgi:beta-lactamase regulating signal transducer with metallopeptidase domain
MAMLHSLWQAALLLLLFITVDKILLRNNSPLAKRNFLFAALTSQLVLFIFTFFIVFSGARANSSVADISKMVTGFLGDENIQAVTPWVFSIYFFIISYKLIKALYSWYHFKQQYKCGLQKPAIDLRLFTELKSHQFGIKRKVKLWLSNSVNTPVTFGFFKPVILLPVALLNNMSTQQAETLILHELTHIRTNDYLLNWFLLFADTVFFYNPFVTSLCNKIRMEREKNCDIAVLAFEYSPALYAETLLQAERMKQMIPNLQLGAVNRKKQLLHRIQFFSNHKIFSEPLRFNIIAPLIGLFLLLLLSSAILFNTGNAAASINTAVTVPYLPFSNYINTTDADIAKNIIPGNKDMETIVKEVEKQKPVIEKQIKGLEPVIKAVQQKAEIISKQVEENLIIPVAIKENDAARQIIIKEEGSGSASVKVYYLSFENGQWILQPEWVFTAKEVSLDSLLKKADTSSETIKRILPQQ